MRIKRTPQEKKYLSYKKDCRNDYGENSKSSRNSIRRKKAWVNKTYRRAVNQVLKNTDKVSDEKDLTNDEVNIVVRNNWRKQSDTPLGVCLVREGKLKKRINIKDFRMKYAYPKYYISRSL